MRKHTSFVEVELFINSLLEYSVYKKFCTNLAGEETYGGLPIWTKKYDAVFTSSGATPPLLKEVIMDMVDFYERNMFLNDAYCRKVLIPLHGPNVVNEVVQRGSYGALLIELPFHRCEVSKTSITIIVPTINKDTRNLWRYGIFVWANRKYLQRKPPQRNVEQIYLSWSNKYFNSTELVVIHVYGFERAFPFKLRSSKCGFVC